MDFYLVTFITDLWNDESLCGLVFMDLKLIMFYIPQLLSLF